MSSILNSIKFLVFLIVRYSHYIRLALFIIHIIIMVVASPYVLELINAVLRESISAFLSNYFQIESGDIPPETGYLDQPNVESNFTQVESRRYDAIRDKFIEDKPSSPRPPEQQNSLFDRSRAPSPEEQKVHPSQEQQRVETGERSNSNLPDSKVTFPIDINKLSPIQIDYAHKYLSVCNNYTRAVRALHRSKYVRPKGPEFEARIIAEKDALWQERQALREYAKNHFDLHYPKDIHVLVEAVTGSKVY